MRPPEHAFFRFFEDFGGFWPPPPAPNFVQNRSGAAPAKKIANFFPLFFDLKKNSDPGHLPGRVFTFQTTKIDDSYTVSTVFFKGPGLPN